MSWGFTRADLVEAALLSLRVALLGTALAAALGVPAGAALAIARFRGRRAVVIASNALMSIPTVLIGLLVYALLSRQGPLGMLELLYTPLAIVLGQALLALPMFVGLVRGAVEAVDPRARETALTLGAGRLRTLAVLVREASPAVGAASLSIFGRVVSELGIALMVGGNIRGETRTLTTAMTLATAQGDFGLAVGLGAVLLCVALGVVVLAEVARR